ncbi:MAG: 3-ketoacyl-ACP reductase [Planctomycetaceae bacterium]|nr:3-ketoacyl-ACP reductase [Planctomycetaceae bacterium]MCB9952201.1 3-ketoacyl-ACP reductase [Planctomycetaceae bacterium]
MSHQDRPVALITGGARGIGLGIATRLAAAGYNLVLNGIRDAGAVAEPMEQLRSLGARVEYAQGDVSQAADRNQIIDLAKARFGRLDALINNAGITSPGRKDILEADEADFDKVMGINLKGPFFLTQLAANWMKSLPAATTRRTVVFVSSISAEFVSTNRGDYCLSKSALGMATQLWATRLAEFGIDVFEVRPGVIQSDMTSGVTEKYDKLIGEGLTLERRWGTPDDVGAAVTALVTGQIPYATGQVLKIDGGMSIGRL